MKLGLFTDPHYCDKEVGQGGRCPKDSLRKIREAMDFFKEEKCNLVVCLGDLIDSDVSHQQEIDNLQAVKQIIDASGLQTVVLMGNHDAQVFTDEEFYGILGEDRRPKDLCAEGKAFLFVDAGYLSSGERYAPGKVVWNDSFYPFPAELVRRLEKAEGQVHLFMHQIIVPDLSENHMLSNAAELRRIVTEGGKVCRVYMGHYHPGHSCTIDGVDYLIPKGMCLHEEAYCTVQV